MLGAVNDRAVMHRAETPIFGVTRGIPARRIDIEAALFFVLPRTPLMRNGNTGAKR
jgi:hypothetical protein